MARGGALARDQDVRNDASVRRPRYILEHMFDHPSDAAIVAFIPKELMAWI
jgi:hypothetical protein